MSPTALSPTVLSLSLLPPCSVTPHPITHYPVTNSPVLSPTVLSPTVLSLHILSPTFLSLHILSQTFLSLTVLSLTVLLPTVLSLTVLLPTVLSLTLLSLTVLSLTVLSLTLLSLALLSPSVLSHLLLSLHILSLTILSLTLPSHYPLSCHYLSCHSMSCNQPSCHSLSCHSLSHCFSPTSLKLEHSCKIFTPMLLHPIWSHTPIMPSLSSSTLSHQTHILSTPTSITLFPSSLGLSLYRPLFDINCSTMPASSRLLTPHSWRFDIVSEAAVSSACVLVLWVVVAVCCRIWWYGVLGWRRCPRNNGVVLSASCRSLRLGVRVELSLLSLLLSLYCCYWVVTHVLGSG